MVMSQTISHAERVRELIEPTLTFLGYEIYDVTLSGSGGHHHASRADR